MRVWSGLETVDPSLRDTSVAIGTFDGVHLGHRALIQAAAGAARLRQRETVVFTFDRHPAEIVSPDLAPPYLSSPRQQEHLVGTLGADHLVVARFDAAMRDLAPEDFVRQVLVDRLGARSVHVGRGFRFGRRREGDEELLRSAGASLGFDASVLEPVVLDGGPISSTRIRQLLGEGEVAQAARLLGRRFALDGVVVTGDRRGAGLGYPTANLEPTGRRVVPADGVYAVRARVGDRMLDGACSIGLRPTVGGTHRTIETYLFDFSERIYGEELELSFVARLRDELRFESLDALVEQMGRDVVEARRLLGG